MCETAWACEIGYTVFTLTILGYGRVYSTLTVFEVAFMKTCDLHTHLHACV